MGGKPQGLQLNMFRYCTHSLLLLREDEKELEDLWLRLSYQHDLQPLAQLYSRRYGVSNITARTPILEGTITRLERGQLVEGMLFDHLVARIADLFSDSSLHTLEREHLEGAPSSVLNLYESVPSDEDWRIEQLAPFIATLAPERVPAVYGRAPGWVYAAIAGNTGQPEFYQFDHALGWIQPVGVRLGWPSNPEVRVAMTTNDELEATTLTITFPQTRLEYFQPGLLPFPYVPSGQGVILDGPLPLWLVTALVRLYKHVGAAWIATFEPRLRDSVVVYSRIPQRQVGELVRQPVPLRMAM